MKQSIATAMLRFLSLMPWWFLHGLGSLVGRLLYRLDGRETRNARANLKIAYVEQDPQQREKLVRSVLIETAKTFIEMPRIWLSPKSVEGRIDPNGVPEKMRRLVAEGKGLILAMPHMGNWEMVASGVAKELQCTGLYRPPRQAFIEPILNQGRSTNNIKMVPTSRSGLKALNQALKDGEVIAILPDQVPKASGSAAAPAPFYGRESLTMTLLGRFAAKHGSPVLFVWANRLANGQYRLEHFVADETIADADPRKAAIALNQAVQRCVDESPAQYQWTYRRFEPVDSSQVSPYH